jgi:hypothetical protein
MTDFTDDLDTPTERDLDDLYGSKYLGAVDVGDKKIRTRILKITKEAMQQQGGKPERAKFVLYLGNIDKPMVLNATNKNVLVEKLGRNPADWKGAELGLFTVATQFAGRPTKGLRLTVLSVPKKAEVAAPAPKSASKKPVNEMPLDDPSDPGFQGEDADFNEAAE